MRFDPFENRHCRDVRNSLGHGFVRAIQAQDFCLFPPKIPGDPPGEPPAHIAGYIHHRTDCLKKVLDQMAACHYLDTDHFEISILLWNLELFFEFHEWLEIKWITARGKTKKALQALVLSAVVYEQLVYGRKIPAKKLAEKAILLFSQHRTIIPPLFDTDLFITKLAGPDPAAPKFTLPGAR